MTGTNEFGRQWWSQRWITAMESFGWSSRLQRGRTYARGGRVRQVDLQAGRVQAKVQGSQAKPYRVGIEVGILGDADWERVIDLLAGQAIFAAKLLAGEIPHDVEQALAAAGLSMFPLQARHVVTSCSCPDGANPCKHIAAVFYVLGAEFDDDPFLIFRLRGRTKEQLIGALRERRAAMGGSERPVGVQENSPVEMEYDPPLEEMLGSFWRSSDQLDGFEAHPERPLVHGALLKRLGPPSFLIGGSALTEVLGNVYQLATDRALELAFAAEEEEY